MKYVLVLFFMFDSEVAPKNAGAAIAEYETREECQRIGHAMVLDIKDTGSHSYICIAKPDSLLEAPVD